MKSRSSRRAGSVASIAVLSLAAACGGDGPPKTPADVPPASPPPVQAAMVAAPPPPATPPEPTAEEEKKAQEARELGAARAKFEVDRQAENARWTPELRAAAAAVAAKTYPSGRAAIKAAMAGAYRPASDAARDPYRHPLETLEFFGFKPTMTVLEILPRKGWYTELLAPALAKQGRLIDTSSDPSGPPDQWSTLWGQRWKALLDASPELYGNVQTVVIDTKAPRFGLEGSVDLVLVMREVHNMVNDKLFDAWLAEIHKALKPGGVLGIEEHRAKPGANPDESFKTGYMVETWVIDTVTAAGFKLAGKSDVNANDKDTKDYPEGVWSLPPTYEGKDVNRDKYAAIGESDRMTLKFVKVTTPK
jgi:predicted methyltransferase